MSVNILGGGPVGSLLSLMLKQKGYEVSVFEKRSDPRKTHVYEGRSINLALSHRGIQALKQAGVYELIEEELIPMNGRMMHDTEGNLTSQPYGKKCQAINSISRARLNQLLCSLAEEAGVKFHFDHKCIGVDLENNLISLRNNEEEITYTSDWLIGADGAFSSLRKAYDLHSDDQSTVTKLTHGYKELNIPAINSSFAFPQNYLHIWPRGEFMLIALPNPEGNFTSTIFLENTGVHSFEVLDNGSKEEIEAFFKEYFPDALEKCPELVDQFAKNPTSDLNIVSSPVWHKNKSLIIGDAAHAIVPFYGQGMNAGFEDCRLLINALEENDQKWEETIPEFCQTRKIDAAAISDLALSNFVEMRAKVADEQFLLRKKLEARLQNEYPEIWTPLYTMVTFSDLPYHLCLKLGKLQQETLDTIADFSNPENIALEPIIERFNEIKQDALQAYL